MKVIDLRTFIPTKDYEQSKSFYQALGFSMSYVSEDLSIFQNGPCTFFLQRYYQEAFAQNLMLQMIVADIEEAYAVIATLQNFDIRFQPIKQEHWGKVVYLWGPAGELWHVTQLNQ